MEAIGQSRIDILWADAEKVSQDKPLIHCITNEITVNDCANVILAAGASPIMAHWIEEVEEITSSSKALCCNLGATQYMDCIFRSAETACKKSIPWLLDPVGVSASTPRRKAALSLIEQFHPTAVRGNLTEIKALIRGTSAGSGVDALPSDWYAGGSSEDILKELAAYARQHHMIVAASGQTDIITDGTTAFLVENGSPLMRKVTGTGCMSSALMTAFLAEDPSIYGILSAALIMGISGQLAEGLTNRENKGTGTFRTYLMDQVSLIDKEKINLLNNVKQVTL